MYIPSCYTKKNVNYSLLLAQHTILAVGNTDYPVILSRDTANKKNVDYKRVYLPKMCSLESLQGKESIAHVK